MRRVYQIYNSCVVDAIYIKENTWSDRIKSMFTCLVPKALILLMFVHRHAVDFVGNPLLSVFVQQVGMLLIDRTFSISWLAWCSRGTWTDGWERWTKLQGKPSYDLDIGMGVHHIRTLGRVTVAIRSHVSYGRHTLFGSASSTSG